MRQFAFLIVLILAATLWAEPQPFERYQSIVDRQMFGPLPPGFDPEKMPSEVKGGGGASEMQMTQEQEKLQASVRFSGLRVSPDDEVFVSFSDIADPKNPRSYYMKVGETSGGWTVLEADPVKATMTVEKDGVEVSLTIGGTSGGKDGATSGGANAKAAASDGARAMNQGHSSGLLGGGSLRNRRILRAQREAEEKRAVEAKRQAEETLREQERQAEAEQRAQEREEQRRQLQAIQEELRKARESRAKEAEGAESDGQDES